MEANNTASKVAPTFWDEFSVRDIIDWTIDARQRTLDLIADLDDAQLLGPHLATVNPLLWEIGHVGWFQEKWVLRHCAGMTPGRDDADSLFDSMAIPHDGRWDLALPARERTLQYLQLVHDRVLDRLQQTQLTDEEAFLHLMSIFHEDMHGEAILIYRQTWEYHRPKKGVGSLFSAAPFAASPKKTPDPFFAGGTFMLGAAPEEPFNFDNEKWAHPVEIKPFAIARAPVTQSEFVAFVEDDGYARPELWSESGWEWCEIVGANHPVFWKKQNDSWLRRDFEEWIKLEPDKPVMNVCWYEAEAYCKWAKRRLPTEAEWEAAASMDRSFSDKKRRFPWGDSLPNENQANLDGRLLGCAGIGAFPQGDSAAGCRQMIGNVWEWTASDFGPFPGFVPDPYKEYSEPWFHTRKVLRGGCWATRGRMLRNTWRNFYEPDRRDIWAGFRTCAIEP